MKKQLLTTVLAIAISTTAFSQNTWYDFDGGVTDVSITAGDTCPGCSVSTVPNPVTGDSAANVTLLEIAANSTSGNRGFIINFPSNMGVTEANVNGLTVTVRVYFASFTNVTNYDSAERFRFYLTSSSGPSSNQKQVNLIEANEGTWTDYTFTYDATGTGDIDSAEIRMIGNNFTNLDNGLKIYVDTITATSAFVLSAESEELENNSLKLTSNPVINTLEISKQIESATIYNSIGKVLKTYNNTQDTTFDVSTLSTGLYLFHAKSENGATQTLRFIKK